MRRLIPLMLLLPLTACDGTASPVTRPPASVAPSSPPPAPASASVASKGVSKGAAKAASKAEPAGSGDPRWGTQYAFLKSSKLSTRQITYDLVEWFDGGQAVKACAEDGQKPAENSYCEGYYIRNNNTKLRTLTVDPDAPIRMTVSGELRPVDLQTFLATIDNGNVIRFDIDANRITKLDHIYLP
jgi:hypothetical protein